MSINLQKKAFSRLALFVLVVFLFCCGSLCRAMFVDSTQHHKDFSKNASTPACCNSKITNLIIYGHSYILPSIFNFIFVLLLLFPFFSNKILNYFKNIRGRYGGFCLYNFNYFLFLFRKGILHSKVF